MTPDELLGAIDKVYLDGLDGALIDTLRSVVKLHKPYDSQNAPYEVAIGWCKGCSIAYNKSINEYASHLYPCPTIQTIEKVLFLQ